MVERLGPLGFKLHTARSRNELVATDFRMFLKDAARETMRGVAALIRALADFSARAMGVPMAGMTHLQHAQPLLLSHFFLAHAEAFFRDLDRLGAARQMADVCPLGAGALGGCAFPVDRAAMAKELGFARVSANSLDAVGDRDFALDFLYALSVLAGHLSRLSEDFVLFASQEFAFVELPDEYSTGSSLMPQKKNPDVWELLRGKSGRINGALVSLLVTLKGLPSSYQRDLQEDKEPVFAAYDQALAMVRIATGAVAATSLNEERLRAAAGDVSLLATEAAHYLVRRGLPFRQAHEVVGHVVREAERRGESWASMPLEKLKTFSPLFEADLHAALTLDAALSSRDVVGGTAPNARASGPGRVPRAFAAMGGEGQIMNLAPMNALPRGFRFAAVNCGLRKPPNLDLGLILCDGAAATAGAFTKNLVVAAPVTLTKLHLRKAASRIRAVIVNSRNANCATGPAGMAAAVSTAQEVARMLGVETEQVLVSSTGVIGVPLRVDRIRAAVPGLLQSVSRTAESFDAFTHAIMTTDTRPKWAAAHCRIGGQTVRLLGCAKGAGMIHPNMATMLCYVVTDVAIRQPALARALRTIVPRTFNAISVDGDTSTNDTVLVLASGQAGKPRLSPDRTANYQPLPRGARRGLSFTGAADRFRWRGSKPRHRN